MRTLILLLVAPIFLAAQPAIPLSPDQFYASLQAVLADVTRMRAQLIAQQAQIADLTAKLAVVSNSCVVVPAPWVDVLNRIRDSGSEIVWIASFPPIEPVAVPVESPVKPAPVVKP